LQAKNTFLNFFKWHQGNTNKVFASIKMVLNKVSPARVSSVKSNSKMPKSQYTAI
jgi:hypothetical protein